jgi:PAS domain S-box-containing protein
LIRDQAEDLGTMFRRQQIETSRSRAILEAVADGVLVTDANKNITLFNASSEQILGLKRTDVIGKSLEYFTGLFGGAARAWMDTIHLWSQNPRSYQPGDVFAEQIILEDGRVISVHLAPVSMRDDYLGTVSIFRDITHQVELDRLKSEFVATVSHELRTPMTSIKGYVDILLLGAAGSLNEQQAQFLEVVKNNTERLTVLVNDLLDISRIEAGRVLLSFQPLELDIIAREALTSLEHRSQEENKDMIVQLEGPPDLPNAFGDLERVRQILDNLLDNAYHYTAEGGHILLRLRQVENEIQIDVQDTGIGIPRELQSRVFERFYRGENALVLATSGTGLGLSIVQHLVEMHQGRIWLESSGVPGEGSTFSFTLPVYTSENTGSH